MVFRPALHFLYVALMKTKGGLALTVNDEFHRLNIKIGDDLVRFPIL